jgi:hypothetical protein
MADIKNLERLSEIAEELPEYEKARRMLSENNAKIIIQSSLEPDMRMQLPKGVRYNVVASVNSQINLLKEEIKRL